MKIAVGKCHIDAVEAGELLINRLAVDPTQGSMLIVKYAYTDSKTGTRLGSSHQNTGWSNRTIEALEALVEAVEADIAAKVFDGGATTGSGDILAETQADDGIPSL